METTFIFLIMNCEKYKQKADHQKQTWLKSLPSFLSTYYHVRGNIKLVSNYEFDDANSILTVKAKDDYNSLPTKVIMAYKAVNERFAFDYIFKTDDDQMVTNTKAFETIKNVILMKKPNYGGNIIDVKLPYKSKYYLIHNELPQDLFLLPTKYCSGRFYFLSKEAVNDLVLKLPLFHAEFLEDYAVGYHLKKSLKENMLFIDTGKIFKDFTLVDESASS